MSARTRSAVRALAVSAALVVVPASPALAQDAGTDPYSGVNPNTQTRNPTSGVSPTTQTRSPSVLPFTGAELATVVLVGAGAVGAGAAMVAAGRRRRVTA